MTKHPLTLKGSLLATSALIGVSVAVLYGTPARSGQATQPPPVEAEGPAEEVIVRGMFIPDVVRETSEVANVLVPEDLVRQGDDTAAQALTRLSGLSVINSRFVYVRGLGERYSSALLNGSPLPSPEPLQRVVPLDLFPSNILQGALVQKTYSPQFPGEFGGGVINLETVGAPNERFISMAVSGGYNTETSFRQGLSYDGSNTDWTGFDNNFRDTPHLLTAAMASGRGRIAEGNFTDGELQEIGRDFVNAPLNLMQRLEHVPGNFAVDISAGDRFNLSWGTVGAIVVLGYDNSWQTRRGIQEEGVLTGAGDIDPVTHYDYEYTRNDIVLNGLVGLNWIGDNAEVRWTNLYVRSVTKGARSRAGYDDLAGADLRTDNTDWFERELASTQLAGTAAFGDWTFSGRAAYAVTSRNAPYEKGITYRLVNGEYLHNASQEQNYTRFSDVNDRIASAGLDGSYTFQLSAQRDAVINFGYAYSDNDRSSGAREFRFLATNAALPIEIQRERVDYLLSDVNIAPSRLVLRETTGADGAAAYRGSLDVHAAYAGVDAEVIPLVRLAAGVRFETARLGVNLVDLFGNPPPPSPATQDNSYWLPAASVTWNFYEDMQLRVAASKTIARPQFRELAPQPYYDPDTDRLYIGNPYLVDSELLNFDTRYEWYFGPNQLLAVGGFYKIIDKPVELIINEVGATQQTTFINAPKAQLYGAEVEIRRFWEPFGGEGWLGRLVWFTAANYTWSKSSIQVQDGDVVFPFSGGGLPAAASIYVQDGDQLQGQSEHLVNFQFGFDDEAMGLQATFLINYASERISTRGRPGFPDLLVDPGVTLDFTLRKTWISANATETEIGFEARNLLGTKYDEFQKLGAGEVINNRYALGQTFSVSLRRRY
jgi:outer membrane receptor protein involved in Fe transport